MKRILILPALVVLVLTVLPGLAAAQGSVGIAGARAIDPSVPYRPEVLINREPIPTLDFKMELVEILPGGTNVLWPTGDVRTPAGVKFKPGVRTGWRVGANSLEGVGSNLGLNYMVGTKLLELGPDKIVLDFRVFEGTTQKVITSQQLSLQNYQEALIEFAAAKSGGRRLALRIIPSIGAIPPLPDYPSTVQYFGFKDGLLIRNTKELLWRGGFGNGTNDQTGVEIPFFYISGPPGLLMISYRPFPGSTLLGYFQDLKLMFKWNEDVYELIVPGGSVLPESGKWAAYVWQADPTPREKTFMAGTVSKIDTLPETVKKILDRMK
jgi:hypothetical protein